ncbi:MAG TPA: exopolysaccharide biosynthesis protein [Thermoanaerobaculia bacterium]|nr:exopolysaccharide biosynthesis protein [Thermoanaerobaculia bacterium]
MSDDTGIPLRGGLSETLAAAARSMSSETISVRELMDLIGEHGLLMLCILLMVPFLFPVSIPGVSTLFSTVVIFTGFGIMMNRRRVWLPERVMTRPIGTRKLVAALHRGSRLMARLDRMTRYRLPRFTDGGFITRLNGVALLYGGVLLIFPLGGVPFSNTLPAIGVLLVAAGITQRDGLFVVSGYVMLLLSTAYFAVLAWLVFRAGKGLTDYISVVAAAF